MSFITYKQADSRWSKKNYNGSSTMATAGCGPTACAMIAYAVDGKTTPLDTMKYMQAHGFAIRNNGTAWNGIPSCLKAFGVQDVQAVNVDTTMAKVWELMNKGYVGVFLFRAGSRGGITWTTSGHYIAVTGYKYENGKHYVYTRDSGGRNHTGWYCYESQMRGLIPKVWLGKISAKAKTKYTGEFPNTKVSYETREPIIKSMKSFAKKIADDNSYTYKKWTSDAKTHQCPICNNLTGKYKGWNCIGYVSAILYHGGGIPVTCSCSGIGNDAFFNDNLTLTKWKKKNGAKWEQASWSTRQAGDVAICYSKGKYKHTIFVYGDGYIADATSGSTGISVRKTELSSYTKKVFRPMWTKTVTRSYLTKGDRSAEVTKWQKFLAWAGFPCGTADGIFGDQTYGATKNFQYANGLTADGNVGAKTVAKAKEVTR